MSGPVALCGCGSRELDPVSRAFSLGGRRMGLRRCRACGLRSLEPRPTEEDLRRAYDPSYYGAGQLKFNPWIERLRDAACEGRAREAERSLPAAARSSARVLDIGCGDGRFLGRLIAHGHEGHGTELSTIAAGRAARVPGLRLHVGPLASGTYPASRFDAVSIWHVLEHVPDPDGLLRDAHRWLGDGGALLIAVPNAGSWQARLFGGSWFHLDPPRHLYHFDRASLTRALERAGFRVERIRTLSWEQNVYGVVQSALNALGFRRDELYEVLKGNRSILSSARLPIEALLAAPLLPAAVLFTVAEAAFGQGGTLEVVARRCGEA